MTIGFVVSFFDFRNDVRKVIEILSYNHKIIVFFKSADEERVLNHGLSGVEYRPIIERNKRWRNIISEQLFLYFKKIPSSRNNYFLMELFKISNLKSKRNIRKGKFILQLQRILPRLINYDRFLKWLKPSCKTQVDDINRFIFFTEIYDDYLLSRLLKEKKDIRTYVYSWDHPCKHTRFSKQLRYLCWSEGIKDDIVKLQGIDPKKIIVSGASQFGYIFEFLNNGHEHLQRTYSFDYIYFGCALGIKELVHQEISIIQQLAELTFQLRPDLKFVVRPYPNFSQWSLYNDLKRLPNIILDDGFKNKDLSVKDADIYAKFEKIWNAKAFLHLGTTLGLEASFTKSPSFIVDFGYTHKNGLSLHSFIHQYQNDKYLVNAHPSAAIHSLEEWKILLKTGFENCRGLNEALCSCFGLSSFEAVAERIISFPKVHEAPAVTSTQ